MLKPKKLLAGGSDPAPAHQRRGLRLDQAKIRELELKAAIVRGVEVISLVRQGTAA
jgi:hypothetical protein